MNQHIRQTLNFHFVVPVTWVASTAGVRSVTLFIADTVDQSAPLNVDWTHSSVTGGRGAYLFEV